MRHGRPLAWAGVAGPVAFVGAWATAGAVTDGYSAVDDAISRLASVHAPNRWLMTAGFVCFGVALPVYGVALREALGGKAWVAATVTGCATLGAAAFSLDRSSTGDTAHGVLATAGYVSLALTPLLAARSLSDRGHRHAAAASRVVSAMSAVCLVATAAGPAHGLFQRLGLTVVDAWLAASAIAILRGAVAPPSS